MLTVVLDRIPSGDAAWLRWVFIVNSFLVLGSSLAAFWALAFCVQLRVCGQVVVAIDLVIKFLAMCAYGVVVGFAVRDVVDLAMNVTSVTVATKVAQVWNHGVMGLLLCLATVVFEVSTIRSACRGGRFSFFSSRAGLVFGLASRGCLGRVPRAVHELGRVEIKRFVLVSTCEGCVLLWWRFQRRQGLQRALGRPKRSPRDLLDRLRFGATIFFLPLCAACAVRGICIFRSSYFCRTWVVPCG